MSSKSERSHLSPDISPFLLSHIFVVFSRVFMFLLRDLGFGFHKVLRKGTFTFDQKLEKFVLAVFFVFLK